MSRAKPNPPQAVVRHRLDYNPQTGIFIWKNPADARIVGKVAGGTDAQSGYRKIHIHEYGVYHAHRLAWLHYHGEYDHLSVCVDHIDGDRSNNAISNLRLATFSQNTVNCKTRRNTETGVKGVTKTKLGRYRAIIRRPGGEKIELGCYSTIEEAAAVRLAASREHFGQFSREDDACRIAQR